MRNYYVWPDFDAIVCEYLPEILTNIGLADFRVATKKLRDSSTAPSIEIIVNSDGGPVENKILYEGFRIYIWVTKDTANEAEIAANETAKLVAAALTILPGNSNRQVKAIEPPLISSVEDEGETQVRNLVGEAMLIPNIFTYTKTV